jgi:murein DD-endopeptidase MepM/ murein hydrolase activator NlpD
MKKFFSLSIIFFCCTLIGALVADGSLFYFVKFSKPSVALTSKNKGIPARGASFYISARDNRIGLNSLKVSLKDSKGKKFEIFNKKYNSKNATRLAKEKITINPALLNCADGSATLSITASDSSFWKNSITKTKPLVIDTELPQISEVTTQHYGSAGGSLVVFYRAQNEFVESGAVIDNYYFKGFKVDEVKTNNSTDASHVVIAPILEDFNPQEDFVKLYIKDAVGNQSLTTPHQVIKSISFPAVRMALSREFFEKTAEKLLPRYERTSGKSISRDDNPSSKQLVNHFRLINHELRKLNDAQIIEVAKKTSSQKLWHEVFEKPLAAKMTASFGERRKYFLNELEAGGSVHRGYDLADTQGALVKASNDGKVLYCGDLGIYGNTVIIDHGQSIQTLYGHLASLNCNEGKLVKKGEKIGITGATGLAGGEHLHFEIRAHGIPVDPKEWLDTNWIKTRFSDPISAINNQNTKE